MIEPVHLEGPVSLVELRLPRLNKRFYVFGDDHQHSMKCPDPKTPTIRIDKFLDQVVASSDKTIDLFLELDFPDKADPTARDVKYQVQRDDSRVTYLSTPDYITDIFHLFYECFQPDKSRCQHKNIRAHYTDVRYIGTSKYILQYAFSVNAVYHQIQLQRIVARQHTSKNRQPPQDLRPIIKSIVADGLKILELLPVKIEDVYSTAKIDKQLRNIDNPEILRLIYRYYDTRLWNSLIGAEDSYRSYTENSTIDDIKVGINHLFDYASMLFEVYVIGRMFRRFGSQTADNVILYLGYIHSTRIVDFLSTIPGIKVGETQRSENLGVNMQCLDLSRFRQPLFD